MIPRIRVLSHLKALRRSIQIRDKVTEVSSRKWRVVSGVSGNTYTVTETDEGLSCTCKTRAGVVCRHLVSALRKTLFAPARMKVDAAAVLAGDKVLVSEVGGHAWHTVTDMSGLFIATKECPEWFPISFVVRHEAPERGRFRRREIGKADKRPTRAPVSLTPVERSTQRSAS